MQDSTRIPISKIRERAGQFLRQNLHDLEEIANRQSRIKLDVLPIKEMDEVGLKRLSTAVKEVGQKWRAIINDAVPDETTIERTLVKKEECTPCGIMLDGISVHPQGRNIKNGVVNMNLTFGGVGIDHNTVLRLSSLMPVEELLESVHKLAPYTRGTKKGLLTRLALQMGRKCVNSSTHYTDPLDVLNTRMPFNANALIDYTQDLYDLVEQVETSYSSTAGLPYCRPKGEAVDAMLDAVLPMVVKAYTTKNGPDELYAQERELFMCQVKNKDDRYENPTEKTRPYVSLPWHFQTLFSVLCQSFCKSLYLFTDHSKSRNAYGFSYANGGGSNLVRFARGTKMGEIKYAVYGDDVDLYWRNEKGLYRCCPDFSQMDGSVDYATVALTVTWVLQAFEKKHGACQFWRNICAEWIRFASNPEFFIEGTSVYTKVAKDGLMTGVVGTTLFDCVKAVLAYEHFIEVASKRPALLEEKQAVEFFSREHGLQIKEGTWQPELISAEDVPGEFLSSQKFLGMRLLCIEHDDIPVWVPSLHFEEWLSLLLTPKRLELHNKMKFTSQTTEGRYLFDRLRGYLTTGGVFNERFRKLCNTLLDFVPNSAICMAVQSAGGKGMKPELIKAVGEEFNYSSSLGWPTLEWVSNLYMEETYKDEALEKMPGVFNCDEDVFSGARKRPKLIPEMVALDVLSRGEVVASGVVELPQPEPPVVEDIAPLVGVAEEAKREEVVKPNKKSKILNVDTVKGETVEQKRVPILLEAVDKYLNDSVSPIQKDLLSIMNKNFGYVPETTHPQILKHSLKLLSKKYDMDDNFESQVALSLAYASLDFDTLDVINVRCMPIVRLFPLAVKFGVTVDSMETTVRQLGYFVLGKGQNKVVTRAPLAPVSKEVRVQIEEQVLDNVKKLSLVTKEMKKGVISKETSQLQVQKTNLLKSLKRQDEPPSLLPIAEKVVKTSLFFKPVSGVSLQEATTETGYGAVRVLALKVLKAHHLTYTRQVREVDGRDTQVFTINGEIEYQSTQFVKSAFYSFYKHVLSVYAKNITAPLAAKKADEVGLTDWADLQEEQEKMVRVYSVGGKPLFIQQRLGPLKLVGNHDKVTGADDGVWIVQDNGTKVFVNFRKALLQATADRLTKLLNEKVVGDLETYNLLIQSYPKLKKLKLSRIEHPKPKRKVKNVEQGSESSSGGSKAPKSPPQEKVDKQQEAQKRWRAAKAAAAQVEHANAELTKNSESGRVRLPRVNKGGSQGSGGGRQVSDKFKSDGLVRNPNPARSQVMAEIQAQKSGGRSNKQRIKNDGRPVSGRLGC